MKLLLAGTPALSGLGTSVSRCSEPYTAGLPQVNLVRTRAFSDSPVWTVSGGDVRPGDGVPGGIRPVGPQHTRHPMPVDLVPFRPRPSGGPPQD